MRCCGEGGENSDVRGCSMLFCSLGREVEYVTCVSKLDALIYIRSGLCTLFVPSWGPVTLRSCVPYSYQLLDTISQIPLALSAQLIP